MHMDVQNLFSDAQAITVTAASTNFLNLGSPKTPPGSPAALKRDIGKGQSLPLLIQVVETFATLTSLTATIETDDNTGFATPKVVGSTGAIPVADLKAGKVLPLNIIPIGTAEKYVRINYTVVGTAATAGKITAGITEGIQTNG